MQAIRSGVQYGKRWSTHIAMQAALVGGGIVVWCSAEAGAQRFRRKPDGVTVVTPLPSGMSADGVWLDEEKGPADRPLNTWDEAQS